MRDSKKILILSNMLVVLFLVLSSSMFTFLSLNQHENKESIIKKDDFKQELSKTKYKISISNSKKSCININFVTAFKKSNNIINDKSAAKKQSLVEDSKLNQLKFDVSDETMLLFANEEYGIKMIKTDNLYIVSLLIQISYAFGLAGLYSNRDVLKLGIY